MKIGVLPKTRKGKRSVIMMILIAVLFVLGSVLAWKPGYKSVEIAIQNPIQAIITLLMFVIGVATSAMATFSVTKDKERSVLVFLAIFAGLYSILGFAGSVTNVFFN